MNSLVEYENNADSSQREVLIEKIKFSLSILINSIQSASHVLKEPFNFSRD